jgi:hypothetical protein
MRLRGRKSYKQNPHYFYSTCSHPVVLHLSREARFEAEKHYSLYFGAWAESTNTTVISSSQIYVNPMADRICIMDSRIGFSPTAHDDLMQIVYDIEPIYLALNTDAKEDIDCWVDNLHGYVEDLVLFHRYPEPPKSGERVSLVFESLDHKYAPQSLPREAQWAYQYILEEGKHDCEVSVRELKWKSQVELTGKT